MTFRTRLFITFFFAALLPIVVLAFIVRHEMTVRLTQLYEARIAEQIEAIERDFQIRSTEVGAALAQLSEKIRTDNRLRAALIDGAPADRRYLLDYAAGQMELAGLSMLQLQDGSGRILSSGHFRNEYDRIERGLISLITSETGPQTAGKLIEARAPEGPFHALARADSFSIGGRSLFLIGGLKVDSTFIASLQSGPDLTVSVQYPGSDRTEELPETDARDFIVRDLVYPYIGAQREKVDEARFIVAHNQSELVALRASVDRWFTIVGGVVGLMALLVLLWASSRISRPLNELAEKTGRLDLDRLDVDFRSDRKDEIGSLSRFLGNMTERLRKSTALIKDAERRAAMGDLARQVNHDIKNGLTPLRNIFRHLAQLADSDPGQMPVVFEERKETLHSSIDYLQGLAANYARLSPRGDRISCDVNVLIRRLVKDVRSLGRATVQTKLADPAFVKSDPVGLRRIVENLLDNAIDSLAASGGRVTISTTQWVGNDGRAMLRLEIADNGCGMSKSEVEKIFQDFYTTKEKGTGLGLSIVRRLVMDLDGAIRVDSEPGSGTTFTIDLPATQP